MSYAKPYIILPKTAKFLNISHFYTHLSLKKLFQGQSCPEWDDEECQEGLRESGESRRTWRDNQRWLEGWVYIIISGDPDLSVRCCITYVLIEHDSLLDSLGSIALRFVTVRALFAIPLAIPSVVYPPWRTPLSCSTFTLNPATTCPFKAPIVWRLSPILAFVRSVRHVWPHGVKS